jgi:hypothetical protein
MFPEKKRFWVNDQSLNRFPYNSWEDWRMYAPDKFLWKDYYPLMWNVRDTEKGCDLQVLFLRPGEFIGRMDIMEAIISLKETDEPAVRDWLAQITWAPQR